MDKTKNLGLFERYLSVWVSLGIITGILLGRFMGDEIKHLGELSYANVNIPIAILIWFMIYPMMVQIDFSSIKNAGKKPKGLILTLLINWGLKPFSMAFFAWLFFDNIFKGFLNPEQAQEYFAGAVLLGAAPCTAMVFVWSYLTDGDPSYTLVQVSINDLILIIAFIPIVKFLLGVNQVAIPMDTLTMSVIIFVLVPLITGFLSNRVLIKKYGESWFKEVFLKKLKPFSIIALIMTLVLLFAFQGNKIVESPLIILIIAIPLTLQTYFIFFTSWFIGKKLQIEHCVLSPAAMIGASNFFELAVAVAIALFGLNSGAALATVVGVLIEVPIMLSLVKIANKWKFTQA
jgi:arsenite transporter